MTSILERFQELQGDEDAAERGAKLLSQFAFKPTTDMLTGEDFAIALAAILAYVQAVGVRETQISVERAGKVFNASISDGVQMHDALGG